MPDAKRGRQLLVGRRCCLGELGTMAFAKAGLARGLAMNATWPVPAPAVQKAVPCDRPYHEPGPTPATTAANNTHTAATAPWNRRTSTPREERCARRSAGKLRPKGAGKPLAGEPRKCRTNRESELKRQSQPRPQPEAGGRRQAGARRDVNWMCGDTLLLGGGREKITGAWHPGFCWPAWPRALAPATRAVPGRPCKKPCQAHLSTPSTAAPCKDAPNQARPDQKAARPQYPTCHQV
jgi:hypothetical protein